MITTVASIFSLLAATAILLLGSGLLGTLLGVRAGIEQFSAALTGIIMSGYFIGYVVGSYRCPRIVRRVGHIRAFTAMAAISAACVIVHGLVVNPYVWWILRLITGIAMVGMFLVVESWLNEQADRTRRGKVFAAYMSVNLFALGLGQFLFLIYGAEELAGFALVALFLALALVPVALTRIPEPRPVEVPHLRLRRLISISPLGTAGALFTGLGNGAFWGMAPLFGHDIGLSVAEVASFMAAVILGGAVLQSPIGHFSDRHDRRLVLALVALFAALAAALVVLAARGSIPGLVVWAILFGGFSFSVYSLAVAHTNDHIGAGEVLEATQGLLLLNGIGAAIGPLVAGLLVQGFGPRTLFGYLAVTYGVLGLIALYRMRVSPPVPLQEQSEFMVMARTGIAAVELDPRAELAESTAPGPARQ